MISTGRPSVDRSSGAAPWSACSMAGSGAWRNGVAGPAKAGPHVRSAKAGPHVLTVAFVAAIVPSILFASVLPSSLSDAEFWRLITELSEPGGTFAQELMSNEDSAQFVIPELKR